VKTKGKQAHRVVRVPVSDKSSVFYEKHGRPWCSRHMDYLECCPCVNREEAEREGFVITTIHGEIVGEKTIKL